MGLSLPAGSHPTRITCISATDVEDNSNNPSPLPSVFAFVAFALDLEGAKGEDTKRTLYVTALEDIVESYTEDPHGPLGHLLRGVATESALTQLSPVQRIAVLLSVANVLAGHQVHVADARSAAEHALVEARSASRAGDGLLTEALVRAGRLIACLTLDEADRDRGFGLLDEAAASAGPELLTRIAHVRGLAYLISHSEGGGIQDLERSLSAYRSAPAKTPAYSPHWPEWRVGLAMALVQRYRSLHEWENLTEAVDVLGTVLAEDPEGESQVGACYDLVLDALDALLGRVVGGEELDRAVGLAEALSSGPAAAVVPGLRDHALFTLACLLDRRWHMAQEPTDLRRALDLLTALRDTASPEAPASAEVLAALAMVMFRYGEQPGEGERIDQALLLVDEALTRVPEDSAQGAICLQDRAVLLTARAKRDGDPADLEDALTLLERAVRQPQTASSARVSLGLTLLTHHQETQEQAPLDRAIGELEAAVTAANGPHAWMRATEALHHVLGVRYGALGASEDLERMRALAEEARTAFADSPGLDVGLSYQLAGALNFRFSTTGDRSVLSEAVAVLDALPASGGADSQRQDHTRAEIAVELRHSYLADGDATQLFKAIALLEDALPRQPAHSFARAQILGLLGLCRRDRYIHSGDGADLDTAVDEFSEALTHLTETHDKYAEIATNLGLALWDRYGRDGRLHDLDRAIDALDTVLNGPTGGGEYPAAALNTLGVALRDRYHVSADPRDLQRCVAALERATASSPATAHALLPGVVLNNYGAALLDRYGSTGDLLDLTRSADAYEESVATAPAGSPNRPRFLVNLAAGLLFRYQHLYDIQDLDRAVRLLDEALAESPDGWVNRPTTLMAQARMLYTRYRQLGRRADRRRAVEAYRTGCTAGLATQPGPALVTAAAWAEWAFEEGVWSEAAEACGLASQAMAGLFEAQFGRGHKERWLRAAQGFPARAAYALAQEGAPRDAVVALERGRALQLSEVLERDRAQLDDLIEDGHGDSMRRYQRANREWAEQINTWEAGQGLTPEPSGVARSAGAADGDRLRAARQELDAAIAEIRRVKGDFLRAPGFDDIAAACSVPLVYLAATGAGGVALVVTAGGESVRTVWLPELTEGAVTLRVQDLREAHDGRGREPGVWLGTLDAVTAWLWNAVMGPVLECLGTGTSAVLVPSGLIGLLPLHAAWTPDASRPTARRYAMDDCVLSYTPNARSLRTAQEIADRVPFDSLLTLHDPLPSRHEPLSFAACEVAAARAHFASSHGLCHEAADVQTVKDALGRHQVHHFACHGVVNLSEPLLSAVLLADDQPLLLGDLLRMRLTRDGSGGVRLVILSSCESQVPGLDLPDETVSLPTGLLQAGVAGITATQWAVQGLASCLLTTRFHQELQRPDATPATALRAAQQWVRDTTNEEKAAELQNAADTRLPRDAVRPLWRALVRRPPHERSFAHICDWAPFSHVGV